MWVKSLYKVILVRVKIFAEAMNFLCLNLKYNASIRTDNDIEKMQYTLLRENHTIEKGLSMRNPRKGFGQQKVVNLIERLEKYISRYYDIDKSFLDYPLSTIQNYIEYTKVSGTEIPIIEEKFNMLINMLGNHKHRYIKSGIFSVTKDTIISRCNSDFESLLYSRHSLRYFTEDLLPKEIIEKALILAQRTPSACNRQAWKTHTYQGEESHNLLKWQGGCTGFENEIHTSILVTANIKAFLSYEVHQAYVDGGLYAMNLINALHSLGVGTIPLSVAFYCSKLKELKKNGISENEVPIVIIGAGFMTNEFKIAVSERKEILTTNIYH